MGVPDNCPCDSVIDLRERMDRLEAREQSNTTALVSIQKDVEYIKANINKKSDFGTKVALAVIGGIITILLTFIAARLGMA